MRKAGRDVGTTQTRHVGWGGFTPLLSGLKIQTEILNYVKEATLAVWQPSRATRHLYANILTLIRNIEHREQFK